MRPLGNLGKVLIGCLWSLLSLQNISTVCNYSERCFLQNDSEALYLKCSYFFFLTWSLVTPAFPEEKELVIPVLLPVGMEWKFWWLSQWEPDETCLLVKVGPACAKSLHSATFQLSENLRLLKQLLKCKMWKVSHKSSCPYLKYFWELEHFSNFFFRPRKKLCLRLWCFVYLMPSIWLLVDGQVTSACVLWHFLKC